MLHHNARRVALPLISLLAALAPTDALCADAPSGDSDCVALADQLASTTASEATLGALTAAYRRCGAGYGLLTTHAQHAMRLGQYLEAAEDLRRELTQARPSGRAIELATKLVSLLPNRDATSLRAIGSSPDSAIHVSSILARMRWIVPMVCDGDDPSAASVGVPVPTRPELYRVWVECPPRHGHAVFFVDDSRTDASPVTNGNRVPEPPSGILRSRLPEVQHAFGTDQPDEPRRLVTERKPSYRLARLLEDAQDLPGQLEVWNKILERDPNDLEALVSRARCQAGLGDPEAARAGLAPVSVDTVRLRNPMGSEATFGLQPSSLKSLQCKYLFAQRKLQEAEKLCNEGIGLGGKVISQAYMARISLLQPMPVSVLAAPRAIQSGSRLNTPGMS